VANAVGLSRASAAKTEDAQIPRRDKCEAQKKSEEHFFCALQARRHPTFIQQGEQGITDLQTENIGR
jgi:hypothetical protein